MASQNERLAWERFREQMQLDEAAYDGQVPVLLLCVPVCALGDACHGAIEHAGGLHLNYDGALATLRLAELTPIETIRLIVRLGKLLRDGVAL